MITQVRNIQIDVTGLSGVRRFIKEALEQVKNGTMSDDEFVRSIESLYNESILADEDWVAIRALQNGS